MVTTFPYVRYYNVNGQTEHNKVPNMIHSQTFQCHFIISLIVSSVLLCITSLFHMLFGWKHYNSYQLAMECTIPVVFFALMLWGRHRESLLLYVIGTLPVLFLLGLWTLYIHQITTTYSFAPIVMVLWLLLTIRLVHRQI
jgi:hypothetical protein